MTDARTQELGGCDPLTREPRRAPGPKVTAWIYLLLSLVIVVAPIWFAAELPTADGPSHTYNAYLASQVRAGIEPFVSQYQLRTMPRSNFVTDSTLRFLGPLQGWETAERTWFTVIALLSAAGWFLTIYRASGVPFAAVTAGWFANNWFLWMGFYDFSFSLAVFLGFVNIIHRWGNRSFWWGVVLLLLLFYAAHLYTFAIATGLLGLLILLRVRRGVCSPYLLAVCIPFVALVAIELVSGSGGSGEVIWTNGWYGVAKAAAGWLIGDSFLSFTWGGLAAGVTVMAITWSSLLQRFAGGLRVGGLGGIEIFVLLSVLGSCIVPDVIGSGSYTSSRWRICAVLTCLPFTVATLQILRHKLWFHGVAPVLLAALCYQSAGVIDVAREVSQRKETGVQALSEAGVSKGDWVVAVPAYDNQQFLRIPPFIKSLARSAINFELSLIHNYEPFQGNFEVRWKVLPPRILLNKRGDAVDVSLPIGLGAINRPIWVLHSRELALVSTTTGVHVIRSALTNKFAVTEITLAKE